MTPERAFRESEALEFRGRPLEPFSFLRQTTAIELGLRYWRLSPDDLYTIKGEAEEVQMYDGMVMDAAIILWVCHQPDQTCRRARRKPRDYEAAIDKWADDNGVSVGGEYLAEAMQVFGAIMGAVNASRGEPDVKGAASPGEPKI